MYPKRDAPLLPAALVPVLGSRAVVQTAHRLPADLRLSDLGSDVWDQFPIQTVLALADEVVEATRREFHKLATSTTLVSLDSLGEELSAGARNALLRAGLGGNPWLTTVAVGDLVREPGIGAKTLLDILVSAGPVVDEVPPEEGAVAAKGRRAEPHMTRSRAVRKGASAITRRRWSSLLLARDPRLGRTIRDLDDDALTAQDAAERLSQTPMTPATARAKVRLLRSLRLEAERLRQLTLEEELDELIKSVLDGSDEGRKGVKQRLGLSGNPPVTLEQAGTNVGLWPSGVVKRLTRERVRQLETRFVREIREARPWTPVLDKCLKVATEAAPARDADIEELLLSKGLTAKTFSIPSLMSIARVLGRELGFEHDRASGFVHRGGPTVSPQALGVIARKLTTHWGCATVDALRHELIEQGRGEVDAAVVRLLLESVPNLRWLDEERDWFWIEGTSRNRLLNQVEKIMSVAGSIGIAELREGAGRWYRMEGFRPPREVLARLCEQTGDYDRDGDLIVEGPGLRPWQNVLGGIERGIAEVLFEHGPIMRRDDLERRAVDEGGLNRSSFYVYLGYSPIVARYAPGVYGLRGARVSAAEVKALIPRRAREQRLLDHGWTSDGRVWIGYRMSKAALLAGVLSVPAALQEFVSGSYVLVSGQENPVGTLVVKGGRMWGVGPFYRLWGVEEGDFVVLTIDIKARRTTIVAGAEELLLRFQEGE